MPQKLKNLLKPTEDQLTYGDIVNQKAKNLLSDQDKVVNVEGLPSAKSPPLFRPRPTTVLGGQNVAKEVENLYKVAPYLRGISPKVQMGPTEDFQNAIDDSNEDVIKSKSGKIFRLDDLNRINLLGLTNIKNHNVSLNPNLLGTDHLKNTIGHEFAHVAGSGDLEAYPLGDLYNGDEGDEETDKKLVKYYKQYKKSPADQ